MSKQVVKKTAPEVAKSAAKTKTPWWVWLIVVLLGLTLLGGLKYWRFTRSMQMRREAAQMQRAKMTEFWKSQGLSDEAIAEKLEEERGQNFQRGGTRNVFGMMFGRMMGRGFGGGQGREIQPR